METIVSAIHSYSKKGDFDQLHNFLKSHESIFQNNQNQLKTSLEAVNRTEHSLGYLHILDALWKVPAADTEGPPVEETGNFLLACDSLQVSVAPEHFAGVCRKLKEKFISLNEPRRGINPLIQAARKLQPTKHHVTPIHADVFQLCLLSKCYAAASELLSDDIYNVDPGKTAMTPTDLFLYCYYGGMICTGRKQYARALELFFNGLTAPALASNAIVAAVHKKYVLVSLIHTGACPTLPKYAPSKSKSLEHDHKQYNELVKAYTSHSVEKLKAAATAHQEIFAQDGNSGLVQLVVQSLTKRNVQRLTQTYLTLSLQDIATNVGLPSAEEAERVILGMIEAGEIHAKIEPAEGMVRFLEDPQEFDNTATVERIDQQLRTCMEVNQKLQAMHDNVSTDKAYLCKVFVRSTDRAPRLDAAEEFAMPYA